MQTVPSMIVVSVMQQLEGPFFHAARIERFRAQKAVQAGCILLPMQMSDVY